ncbi:splicing factor YJU2-like isoform X2 [Phoenix dactylifera]|uniref:Splicing factor YJU2-like isoform X2 n=1 Tax=Phoenix dactylifera TaxID=42345 RepID=A0A8B8ZLM6_PHODC|nr:splicing factor YJU2-like isoform X2 [Phoenix dactylifera]
MRTQSVSVYRLVLGYAYPAYECFKTVELNKPEIEQLRFWCQYWYVLATCQTYLGIQIFRFYFKCTRCSAEIAFKTDPQNSDYVVASGASRNFEPWREEDEAVEKEKKKRAAEEMGDAMKSLENRAVDSKRDMDILAALEEMRSMKVPDTSTARRDDDGAECSP